MNGTDVQWCSRWVRVEGVRTHYVEAGEGDPVVLVHGGGPGASAVHGWSQIIPRLTPHFRVIALDVLGYGETDKPASLAYSHQDQVDHLAAFVQALCLEPVKLAGNSMGAYLAAKCALDHPGDVAGIFAVSSGTIAYAMGLPNPANAGRKALAEFDGSAERLRVFLESILARPPAQDLVERRVEMFHRPGGPEAWAAMSRYNRRLAADPNLWQRFSVADRLPRMTIPMTILWGADDGFAPVEQAYELDRLLPNVTVEVLEGAGHQAQNDRPDEVAGRMVEFLQRNGNAEAEPAT